MSERGSIRGSVAGSVMGESIVYEQDHREKRKDARISSVEDIGVIQKLK